MCGGLGHAQQPHAGQGPHQASHGRGAEATVQEHFHSRYLIFIFLILFNLFLRK